MPPNDNHKIVHSSATHIQNLNTIRVVSKKLLTIKSVKCFFKHLVHSESGSKWTSQNGGVFTQA